MNLSKRQEAELVTAIQGRGEIPLKFAYLGEGATHWDSIARERSGTTGGINSAEAILLQKRLDDFLSTINLAQGVNIIDIGCGNGEPILPVLEKLQSSGIMFTYVPMDISKEMLDLAYQTVSKKIPTITIKPVVIDFELGQFSEITADLKKNGS